MLGLNRMLKMKAVYWASTGVTREGQPALAEPIELRCRWEEKTEEFIASDGTKALSRAFVFVSRDVSVGGLLRLGPLSEVEAEGFPADPRDGGAWEIRLFNKMPTIKQTEYVRQAYL